MKEQIGSDAHGKSAAPALVSFSGRAVVAVTVVCASVASVWLAQMVSTSLPPEMAQAQVRPGPRMASTLPTVTVVGRRESLDEAQASAAQAVATEMSSMAWQDESPGRVKFRQ